MNYKKLSAGFLVTDLKEPETSSGLIRLAPKILQYGAEQLARSATYMFALHNLKIAGASAAINTKPEQRAVNLKSFLDEISPLVSEKSFLPNAGKGIVEPLNFSDDPRSEIRLTEISKDCKLYQYCIGVSAVSAVNELLENGLENKSVSIESFDANAFGTLKALEDSGAKLIGISDKKNFVHSESGIDFTQVAKSWEENGNNFLASLGSAGLDSVSENGLKPAEEIFTTPTDVLFVGSKMGVIDHTLGLDISALVSLHPIPYTTKALVTLDRKGVIVPPDFLCVSGQVVADWTTSQNPEEVIQATNEKTKELTKEMNELSKNLDSSQESVPNLFLAGCKMAEDFLMTWQDELPFGRSIL